MAFYPGQIIAFQIRHNLNSSCLASPPLSFFNLPARERRMSRWRKFLNREVRKMALDGLFLFLFFILVVTNLYYTGKLLVLKIRYRRRLWR